MCGKLENTTGAFGEGAITRRRLMSAAASGFLASRVLVGPNIRGRSISDTTALAQTEENSNVAYGTGTLASGIRSRFVKDVNGLTIVKEKTDLYVKERKNNMMKHILIAILFVMFTVPAMSFAQDDIRWIPFPDSSFEVNGLPWFDENSPDLFRLPKRLKGIVREPVWNLAQSTSGALIRFKSDCSTLAIRYENLRMSGMKNMHVFGQSGVDLYSDNIYIGTAIHGKDKDVEHIYFRNASSEYRGHVLYLPLYNGLRVKAIGVNPDAVIKAPSPFAVPRPVVFYGTSITQGGCASRAGMS